MLSGCAVADLRGPCRRGVCRRPTPLTPIGRRKAVVRTAGAVEPKGWGGLHSDAREPVRLPGDVFERGDQVRNRIIEIANDAAIQTGFKRLVSSSSRDATKQAVQFSTEVRPCAVSHRDRLPNAIENGIQLGGGDDWIVNSFGVQRRISALLVGRVHRSIPLVGETKIGGVLERGWAHPAGSDGGRCCRAGSGHAAA